MCAAIRRAILPLALLAGGATGAFAAPVECVYDTWRGAQSSTIAISWVGIGFTADTARGVVQVRVPEGYYDAEKSEVVKQANFTGLVFYRKEKASDGSSPRVRYSFRLYTSGKCEGRMEQDGYTPVIGSGRIK